MALFSIVYYSRLRETANGGLVNSKFLNIFDSKIKEAMIQLEGLPDFVCQCSDENIFDLVIKKKNHTISSNGWIFSI